MRRALWVGLLVFLLLLVPQVANAGFSAARVVKGLHGSVAFTFDGRGKVWVVDRHKGYIWIVNPATGFKHRFFRVTHVTSSVGQGFLAIALHPQFPKKPYVYAYATRKVGGSTQDQILRITNSGGRGHDPKVIFRSAASPNRFHEGARMAFGPDGMLYLVLGDATIAALAQDQSSPHGKMLRMTPSGGVPADNPFPHSRVWATGIRNSFGFDFDPETGRLWETENGPECNDELNVIRRGRNYGWGPGATCTGSSPGNTNRDGSNPTLPKAWYTPPPALTGAAFCEGCRLGPNSEGALFVAAYNTGQIRRMTLSKDRTHVRKQKVLLRPFPHVLSMESDPKGRLYFSTNTGIFRMVRTGRSRA